MPDLPIAAPGQRTGYRVRLAVFEGPLDLLLHLIEREELDITRVSLARVTDQYLEYLAALEELQVDDLADFVVVAARLLLIKSQALLPRPPTPTPQEDERVGEELIRQLLAYKQFKEAAQRLQERTAQGLRSYVRLAPPPHLGIGAGLEHLEPVSLEVFLTAARRALKTPPPAPSVDGVVAPFTITIDDQIKLIAQSLARQPQISFTGLLTVAHSRQEISVTLLAVLELIKQLKIQARQERMFGEIVILALPQNKGC
jgi:segregation and condensation protein A